MHIFIYIYSKTVPAYRLSGLLYDYNDTTIQSAPSPMPPSKALPAELMWKLDGWCLLRPVSADQSVNQTGVFWKGVLKRQALKQSVQTDGE